MIDGPKSDRQVLHERRAAALQERASERETRVMSAEEIVEALKRTRQSGKGCAAAEVETADGAALLWSWW